MGAALLCFAFIIGVGSFLILHQIGNRIHSQIELDQLTGSIAIALRASIITLEQSEKRLRIARAVMISGCAYIPSCPAFQRAYELQKKVEYGIQKIAERNWEAQKIKWLVYQPLLSQKNDFPVINDFSNKTGVELKVRFAHLRSTAKIWGIKKGIDSHEWKIAWVE